MDLLNSKIQDLTNAIRTQKISATDVCRFYLDRIEKLNPKLNAVLTVNDKALLRAKELDSNLQKYKDLPLLGITFLLKDVFCVKKMRTTAGSKILENFISPYSSEVAERLEQAGAVILGKCNQDEFAMGNSNENSFFGPVLNPWNDSCVPGGSSGGSAAAVAAGLCVASIGTDTGGSVRQPSSFCNLVGIKPTYGRVSRYGIIAYGSSLDQAGPMTMYVEDSAYILEVISGWDKKDSTSLKKEVPQWSKNLKASVKNLRVGILNRPQVEKACSKEVQDHLKKVEKLFTLEGGSQQDVSLSLMDISVPVYYLISTSEASSNLARYDGVRYGWREDFQKKAPRDLEDFYSQNRGTGFGSEVKRRIIMGTYCLSSGYYDEYYKKASQIRRKLRDQFIDLFSEVSILVAPVAPSVAFKLGEKSTPEDLLKSYLMDAFTVAANLTGLPALSVPVGFSKEGMPLGVQLIAPHFEEQRLFDVAGLIQEKIGAVGRRPPYV